ncbi:MAG: ECF transporter S component [Lactobacillaceae bacterium]|jgi:energy-coupling factor transport system substrate-specific component|nr:ECF transporter S component [Lactobacillaceae bacterium]
MQTVSNKKRGWSLRDVIFLSVIAIFFGVIYQVWGISYNVIAATPLKPFANDLTLGVWIMAGPLAGIMLQKVGATTIGELLAATVEMFLFSQWGAANIISGLVQGFASELGFAATGYKNWSKLGLLFSTITATIVSFIWDLFQSGYMEYHFSLLVGLFVIRFISIGFFAGVLVYWINALVVKSGLLKK